VLRQTLSPSPLIITEFLAGNSNNLLDEDGEQSDWLEIYNRSDHPLNLAGWALTNNLADPEKWAFPNRTLNSHDYLVIFASGKNRRAETGKLHTNFKLNQNGEFIALYNLLEGRFMDIMPTQQTRQFENVSFGRQEGAEIYGYLPAPSPGAPNNNHFVGQEVVLNNSTENITQSNPAPIATVSLPVYQPNLTPTLQFSEIMYNPIGGDDYEFIELQNVSPQPLNLGMATFEGVDFTFPFNTPPLTVGAKIVLVRNKTSFSQRYPNTPIQGVYEGQLSNQGETLTLRDLDKNILIKLQYADNAGWPISPDGLGDSLELINLTANPNNPQNWHASPNIYGSPGQ